MTYNLGAVGFGHWFNRLYVGLMKSNEFRLAKIAGVSDVKGKMDRLRMVGLEEKDYYRIDEGKPIPEDFYEGLDVVHISDPNEFHAEQTIESLRRGKFTITEKTWGVNREEFSRVVDFIKSNRLESRAYLHLHYLHKQLTMQLESLLTRYTDTYGKVTAVSSTFFEVESDEDIRRKRWLFSQRSGGLFMDWIHPFEIMIVGARANMARLDDARLFVVNSDYDTENPTGIEARLSMAGKFFAEDATGVIRVAKGSPRGAAAVRFYFSSGSYLDLEYLHSEFEFRSAERGRWTLYKMDRPIESGNPIGLNTSDLFIKEIVNLCRGGSAGLTTEEATTLFEPQWRYMEIAKGKELVGSKPEVESFIDRGIGLER